MTATTTTAPVTNPVLSKDEFFKKAPALRTVTVNVPELGGVMMFSQLDGRQAGRLEAQLYVDGNFQGEKSRAIWIIACARTADGKPVFDDTDLPRISALPMPLLDRLSLEAKKLNAFGGFAEVAESDAKNSVAAPSGGSA